MDRIVWGVEEKYNFQNQFFCLNHPLETDSIYEDDDDDDDASGVMNNTSQNTINDASISEILLIQRTGYAWCLFVYASQYIWAMYYVLLILERGGRGAYHFYRISHT